MKKFLLAAAPAVLLAALWLRLPGLGEMPFHTDEANNAVILEESLSAGGFQYRPHEHHGPTLFWLAAPVCKMLNISGAAQMTERALRLAAVACGALAAVSILWLGRWLGKFPALVAALTVSVAAPFHYYSRVFIHESLLLLLTVWLLVALFHWRATGRPWWAIASGVIAALMVATKENAAVTVALVAWPFALPAGGSKIRWREIFAALSVSVALALLLIGPENLWLAAQQYTRRGLASGHDHPWWQFFAWYGGWRGPGLPWSFWLVSAAAAVAAPGWRRRPAVLPLLLGGAGLLAFHSALPYKTPWLLLTPLLLLSLSAAAGIDLLVNKFSGTGKALALGVWLALLFTETWSRSFHHQVRDDNPLAYAPTSPAAAAIARDLPADRAAVIQVVAEDYWPLPWLLREYPRTGYWRDEPAQWLGDALICSPEALALVPDASDWQFAPHELRPGVLVFVGTKIKPTHE